MRSLIGISGLLLTERTSFAQPVRKVHRIGVLTSATASGYAGPERMNANAKALLRGLGELGYVYGQLSLEIKDAGQIEAAFKTATEARAGALLVFTGHHAYANRLRIAELAARYRLPAM